MYRLFDHFWFQRVPVTLIEAFTPFGPLPPVELGDLRGRLPGALRRGEVLRQHGAARHAGESRVRRVVSRGADAAHRRRACSTPGSGSTTTRTSRREPRAHSHDRSPDDAGDEPRRADAHHRRRARRTSAPTAASPTWRRCAGTHALTFYSHITGFRFDHLEVAKRVFSGPAEGKLRRARPAIAWTCSGSVSARRPMSLITKA